MVTGTANFHYLKLGDAFALVAAKITVLPRSAIAGFTSAFGFVFFVCHFCQSPFNFHKVKRISKN
jgi:hypothetical protein